jgi:hypothetical protein
VTGAASIASWNATLALQSAKKYSNECSFDGGLPLLHYNISSHRIKYGLLITNASKMVMMA